MRIAVDENIPFAQQAFAELGEVWRFPGRQLQAKDLQESEILLVRSITQVNADLLKHTPVCFVGTATIGVDHIDRDYLAAQQIGFAYAPGCNATSAAEYVVAAILVMAERLGWDVREKSVGIIGCGNVGSRVKARLQALGMRCLVNDPPLAAMHADGDFLDLAEVLQADIVTLHVPLEKAGAHPTLNLANADFFQAMRDDALFINTSRGSVVDEAALLAKLAQPSFHAVLDVWRNEPNIDPLLLSKVDLATPHIAGYSFDGKVRGTDMLYQALCDFLAIKPSWQAVQALPAAPIQALHFSAEIAPLRGLHSAVMAAYDPRRDDAALRRLPSNGAGAYFDLLRKQYPVRREFACLHVRSPDAELTRLAAGLGFPIN